MSGQAVCIYGVGNYPIRMDLLSIGSCVDELAKNMNGITRIKYLSQE